MADEKKLLPCPFCGGEAKFVDVSGYWCSVMCRKCNACSNSFSYSCEYAAKDLAIEAWNRRAYNG